MKTTYPLVLTLGQKQPIMGFHGNLWENAPKCDFFDHIFRPRSYLLILNDFLTTFILYL